MLMLGKRALRHSEPEDEASSPPPLRPRRWFGTPPKEYQGQSRYGPCTFYYFPDTYTWLLRCRNKFHGKSKDLPLVIDHPEAHDFLNDEDVIKALDNPGIIPILDNATVATPSNQKHPGYCKMRNTIFMSLYSDFIFQRKPLKVGDHFVTHMADNKLVNQAQVESITGFAEPLKFETDGNWMWVAWRDTDQLRKETGICDDVMNNILLPMINLSAGYTGFYKASPVITRDDDEGHIRVDCAHNLSFWAEVYTK